MRAKHIDEQYQAFVRSKPCIRCNLEPPSDPHHLISVGWRAPWRNDYMAIPCCRHCHSLYESPGMTVAKWLELRKLPAVFLAECVADLLVEYFSRRCDNHVEVPF